MKTDKVQRRAEMKAVRAALSDGDRAAASRRICQHLLSDEASAAAEHWFVYVSFRDEVDTRELIDLLMARGKQVYVPRTESSGGMLALEFPGWKAMRIERFGFLAPPIDARPADHLDVCLCPGLAFTRDGARLGYGAGHYDRFMEQWPKLTTVGLAFEPQLVPSLPQESTDRLMDYLASEAGIFRCEK